MDTEHHHDDQDEPTDGVIWSRYQKAQRAAAVRANDAFVLAMAKAVKRGRENVKVGTYKDSSPPINARRIHADVAFSSCGSPAAMCMSMGGAHSGAETMK